MRWIRVLAVYTREANTEASHHQVISVTSEYVGLSKGSKKCP